MLRHAFSSVSRRIGCQRVIDYRAAPPLIILHLARHTGVLLACFTVDYRVLFEPLTDEIVQDGFQYYRTFYNAPPGIKVRRVSFFRFKNTADITWDMCTVYARRISQALLHGLIGIGLVAIITKIHRWDESAMFFDGGSLGERRSFFNISTHPLSP